MIKKVIKNKYVQGGFLGVVGFILSPLSWWNDLFVNLPLSFAFAWAASKILLVFYDVEKGLFLILMIIGYWISNLLGFLMMHKGAEKIIDKKRKNKGLVWNLAVTSAYTALIVLFFYFTDPDVINDQINSFLNL